MLGELIRDKRVAAGLSIRQLAVLIGTSHTFVSRLERGDYARVSITLLRRLADELSLGFEQLLAETNLQQEYSALMQSEHVLGEFEAQLAADPLLAELVRAWQNLEIADRRRLTQAAAAMAELQGRIRDLSQQLETHDFDSAPVKED